MCPTVPLLYKIWCPSLKYKQQQPHQTSSNSASSTNPDLETMEEQWERIGAGEALQILELQDLPPAIGNRRQKKYMGSLCSVPASFWRPLWSYADQNIRFGSLRCTLSMFRSHFYMCTPIERFEYIDLGGGDESSFCVCSVGKKYLWLYQTCCWLFCRHEIKSCTMPWICYQFPSLIYYND